MQTMFRGALMLLLSGVATSPWMAQEVLSQDAAPGETKDLQQRDQELRTLEKSGQFRLNASYDDGDLLKLKAGGVYRTTRRDYANRQTDCTTPTGFTYSLDEVNVPGPDKRIQGRYLLTPNLSDAGRRELVGPDRAYLQEAAEYGRTFFVGVTASF